MHENFLSCDWGTSSFRLRLAVRSSGKVLASVENQQGIAATWEKWKQTGGQDPTARQEFYWNIISNGIRELERVQDTSLEGLPLLISGMASADIGITPKPYRKLPAKADGSDLQQYQFVAPDGSQRLCILVSGACTENDVMRGEEIQVVGAFTGGGNQDGIYLLPGTHSKHILVQQGNITDIRTFMTGEVFELLAQRSILSGSVLQDPVIDFESVRPAFLQGVQAAAQQDLLHAIFLVRTNSLFHKLVASENYYYLSGILVGSELKGLHHAKAMPVVLVSSAALRPLYETALEALFPQRSHSWMNVDSALILGHCSALSRWWDSWEGGAGTKIDKTS